MILNEIFSFDVFCQLHSLLWFVKIHCKGRSSWLILLTVGLEQSTEVLDGLW